MATQERLYTAEDLLALPDNGKRYELDRGRLIVMPPPKREHGLIAMEIGRLIANYVKANNLGIVSTEIGYQLSENPDTVRAPDVSFTSKARVVPAKGEYDRVAPDLAIEVISPSNTQDEIQQKVIQYFRAGTRLVWAFFPKSRSVYVYRSAHEVTILGVEDTLDGGDVLPGFHVEVGEIFSVLDES